MPALAEANRFQRACQPIPAVSAGIDVRSRAGRFDLRKRPQYPRTVVQTWRNGCDRVSGPRRFEWSLATAVAHPVDLHRPGLPDVTGELSRGQGQADLPAEQSAPCQGARLPAAHAYPGGARHRAGPPPQGPPLTDCLTHGSLGVLPAQNRMTRSAEFSHTVKRGVRASQPDLVVHASREARPSPAAVPQIGFIVAKSVGGAVERHRVARRLRHAVRALIAELDPADRIVVRALPGSRDAISARLREELRAGVRRAHDLLERRR